VARHRSPQGRRAHLGPPLSAALAAAGVGGAHRSIPLQQLTSSLPARFVATVVAGGALAATAQHALAQTLPVAADGAALRVAVEELIGAAPASEPAETFDVTGAASVAFAPVVPEAAADLPADLPVADAASLVKAADIQRAAAEVATARAADEAKAADAARAAEEAAKAAEAPRAAESASVGGAVQMVLGRVTSGFGSRWGRAHEGLDIAAPIGTPIRVPLAGTVIESGPASGFGMWVKVRHADGTVTTYGHINRSLVRVGQEVAAGEVIAEVGNRGQSTGPHLHIEVTTPGGNKINPRPWLDDNGIGY
jgi:murein DD-endopeptidase MepM/ murein hydrolase activator NlpD